MENINLSKEVYNKDQYTKVIDTSFSQLNVPQPQEEKPLRTNEEIEGLISEVDELRNLLTKARKDLTLNTSNTINTINTSNTNDTIDRLNQEIQDLQEEIQDLQEQLSPNPNQPRINELREEINEAELTIKELEGQKFAINNILQEETIKAIKTLGIIGKSNSDIKNIIKNPFLNSVLASINTFTSQKDQLQEELDNLLNS